MWMLNFFLCFLGGRIEFVNLNNKYYWIMGKEKEEIDVILYYIVIYDVCGYLSEYYYVGFGYNYFGIMLIVFLICIL